MRVFRIAKEKWVADFSGRGAELYGGRWNFKGLPALYTSESLSLCVCETLVHLDKSFFPVDFFFTEIEISDSFISDEFKFFDFKKSAVELGSNWLQEKRSLAIRVPSAVVRQEYNVIINPLHKDFQSIKMIRKEPFLIDKRLWQL